VLVLVVDGSEAVFGIHGLVLGLFLLGLDLPDALLVKGELPPTCTWGKSDKRWSVDRADIPMILDRLPWLVSIDPGTCFCLTKSARKSMNALGGRGMYPWLRRFPGGHRLRVGPGAGVIEGGKRAAVGEKAGCAGSSEGRKSSVSVKVTGVTLGAKVTGFRP
jgi:hypothetical protein